MFLNGVHAQSLVPNTWQYAVGALLGQSNGKTGCSAVRVINLLDPIGKMFFNTHWKRAKDVRYGNCYGFYKDRRCE